MSSFLFLFGREKRAARRQFVGAVSRLQLPFVYQKRKKSDNQKEIIKLTSKKPLNVSGFCV